MPNFRAMLVFLGLSLCPSIVHARLNLIKDARCLIKGDEVAASLWAASVPGSAEEGGALVRLGPLLKACTGKSDLSGVERLILSGEIAERQLRKDNAGVVSRRYSGFNPSKMDDLGVSERTLERARSWPTDVAIIYCASARDPASADAILNAKPGSKPEKSAMGRLAATMARCVDNGQTAALDRNRIRAIVARMRYSEGFTRLPDVNPAAVR